ncbi:hypothetical protein Mapa_017034 [Marchantia paleacea]|nr:hypothetical protein Mapa_017034 [Marchantia paleacea]
MPSSFSVVELAAEKLQCGQFLQAKAKAQEPRALASNRFDDGCSVSCKLLPRQPRPPAGLRHPTRESTPRGSRPFARRRGRFLPGQIPIRRARTLHLQPLSRRPHGRTAGEGARSAMACSRGSLQALSVSSLSCASAKLVMEEQFGSLQHDGKAGSKSRERKSVHGRELDLAADASLEGVVASKLSADRPGFRSSDVLCGRCPVCPALAAPPGAARAGHLYRLGPGSSLRLEVAIRKHGMELDSWGRVAAMPRAGEQIEERGVVQLAHMRRPFLFLRLGPSRNFRLLSSRDRSLQPGGAS